MAAALDVPISSIFHADERDAGASQHTCPVSASGQCIGEQVRSHRGRPPRGKRTFYGEQELRLLKMTDFLAVHGSKQMRQTLTVVLEALVSKAGMVPPRSRR